MGFGRLFRRLRGNLRGQTPPPGNLKYSDYLVGAAIVTGIVGASFGGSGVTGVVDPHTALVVTFFAGLITTILVGLSQFLQSRGD